MGLSPKFYGSTIVLEYCSIEELKFTPKTAMIILQYFCTVRKPPHKSRWPVVLACTFGLPPTRKPSGELCPLGALSRTAPEKFHSPSADGSRLLLSWMYALPQKELLTAFSGSHPRVCRFFVGRVCVLLCHVHQFGTANSSNTSSSTGDIIVMAGATTSSNEISGRMYGTGS
jgi:hypothetical protein